MFVLIFVNFHPRMLSRKLHTRAQASHGNITVLSLLKRVFPIHSFGIKLRYAIPGGFGGYSLHWPIRGGSARKVYLFQASGLLKVRDFTS